MGSLKIGGMRLTLDGLRGPGYWYVGTPYSRYYRGRYAAFQEACDVIAELTQRGIGSYSPIVHMHFVAKRAGLDPCDNSIWLPIDKPMMDAARGMVVVMLPGWDDSHGIKIERGVFERANKPIHFLEWSGLYDVAKVDRPDGANGVREIERGEDARAPVRVHANQDGGPAEGHDARVRVERGGDRRRQKGAAFAASVWANPPLRDADTRY